MGRNYSKPVAATSGPVQGFCHEITFFILFLDSLLRRIKNPATAFADDVKFVVDVTLNSCGEVQTHIKLVAGWPD